MDALLSGGDADKGRPLPLKYFILPLVRESITRHKGKLFVWCPASGRLSMKWAPDLEIYALQIQKSSSAKERE